MISRERVAAATATLVAPVVLRVLSLPRALAFADRWPRIGRRASAEALARRVARWLRRAPGPWRSTCLTRSVVLYTMLRQHGYHPRLHVGVSGRATDFRAHAWITVSGRVVGEGDPLLAGFRELWGHRA